MTYSKRKTFAKTNLYMFKYEKQCRICGDQYGADRYDQLYCSNACAQKAYRRKRGALSVECGRVQAVETKRVEFQDKVCEQCGTFFEASLIAAKRRFCSDRCKQRAYRERKA